jgi:NADH:ubiquinone oxidoreductase subunit 3 (subunit A)
MTLILFSLTSALFLVVLLKLVNILLAESSLFNREELSAFECGFDSHRLSRVPFSLRYFFLTLIFLLFDLEIVLLIFSPSIVFYSSILFSSFLIFVFVFVLLLSLFYELSDGTLEWVS